MSTTENQKLTNGWKLIKMVEEILTTERPFNMEVGNFGITYQHGIVTVGCKADGVAMMVDTNVDSLAAWLTFTRDYPMDNYTANKLRNTVNIITSLS